ncbi:MAG: hypothetical protein ABFD54_00245 [Armatimonadota bacterium]|nr:hypothetical protein [bacterium]
MTWRYALGASLACAILWWTHAILTDVFPPFENWFDIVLWVVCSLLKLASILSIPWALGRVFVRCHGSHANTARAVAVLVLASVCLLVVLSALREPLAIHLNNDAARFYPTSMSSTNTLMRYDGNEAEYMKRWQSGRTFLTELGVILLAAVSLWPFARFLGKHGLKSGIAASLWLAIFALAASQFTGLLVADYDFFFGGTLVGPVSLDVVAPFVAADPSTEIGSLVYLTIIVSCWVLDRFWLARLHASHLSFANTSNAR